MTGLGAAPQPRFLHLDKIADLGALLEHRAGPKPRKRPDFAAGRDHRPFDVRESANHRPVSDLDPRPKHHMRLDRAVTPKRGIGREPHAFRVDQCRALLQRFLASPSLPVQFQMCQFGAAVDPRGLERLALDHHRMAA